MSSFSAYHRTYVHEDFKHTYYVTARKGARVGDTLYVISGDRKIKPNYFLEGRYIINASEAHEVGQRLLLVAGSRGKSRLSINNQPWFDDRDFRRYFVSVNMNRINPDYVSRFDEMLRIYSADELLISDLARIDTDNMSDTEREVLALARIGQGVFRANVVQIWGLGDACALTGSKLRSLLVASHVRPWRDCRTANERLDGANGILLCAHVDRLFDQNLVSFDGDGGIVVGPTLTSTAGALTDLKLLGITLQSRLNMANIAIDARTRFTKYLGEHRLQLQ